MAPAWGYGVHGFVFGMSDGTIEPTARASIGLVDKIRSRISVLQAEGDARLVDALARLDVEEARGRELQARVDQADLRVVEAELWLTQLTYAIHAKIAYGSSDLGGIAAGQDGDPAELDRISRLLTEALST